MASPENAPAKPGDAEPGVFAGSGSFRMDRSRTLRVLRDYQFRDPASFLKSWARCAAAGGATFFRARAVPAGRLRRLRACVIEVVFDGRPFARPELGDPFACLFNDGANEDRRGKEFAYGLLAVLRLGSGLVSVSSGEAPGRLELRVTSLETASVGYASDAGPATVVRVSLDSPPRSLRDEPFMGLEPMPEFPARAEINGFDLRDMGAPGPWAATGTELAEGPLRCRVERASWGTPPYISRIELLSLGVRVETLAEELPLCQVSGFVNDDGFALDNARETVVRDDRFKAAMKLVRKAAAEVMRKECEAQTAAIPAVRKHVLEPGLRKYWAVLQERGAPESTAGRDLPGAPWELVLIQFLHDLSGTPAPSGSAREVFEAAVRTLWLRDAAIRCREELAREPDKPGLRELYRAPLFMGAEGGWLAIKDLAERVSAGKNVVYAAEPRSGGFFRSARPLAVCRRDISFLQALYGDRVKKY